MSWPYWASVNAGIDKSSYLSGEFALTFPTVNDITTELKRLGCGALFYKADVSRAFRHVEVDPGDYDLLVLYWKGNYGDSCIPFGTHHESQIFHRLCDDVRFIMCQKGFTMLDYIDDYIGIGSMVENYASAIKASFVLYELPFAVFHHHKIKYFIKSLKINRSLTLETHNIIDLSMLRLLSKACLDLPMARFARQYF